MSDQGLTERRPWGHSTVVQGIKISRDWLMMQLDGAGRIVAGFDPQKGAYPPVACWRSHYSLLFEWRRSSQVFGALEQALGEGSGVCCREVQDCSDRCDAGFSDRVQYSRGHAGDLSVCAILSTSNVISRSDEWQSLLAVQAQASGIKARTINLRCMGRVLCRRCGESLILYAKITTRQNVTHGAL